MGKYLQQLQDSTGLTVSGEALATRIPVPKLSYCDQSSIDDENVPKDATRVIVDDGVTVINEWVTASR